MPSIRAVLALAAGAALLVGGCQSDGESMSAEATTSGESAATGALSVTATDAAHKPVADVEVELERALDCDLTNRVIFPGTSYTNHFTETTDEVGRAEFTGIPLGCYQVSAKDPAGVELKPGAQHEAFLTEEEPHQQLGLTFGKTSEGGKADCLAEEISEDLDIPEEQREAEATIVECEPNWSVIRWDVPGDSQRVVRYFGDKWVTYVAFPHNRCWKQAKYDGAPPTFEQYFQSC
jgi:hypothetical protein